MIPDDRRAPRAADDERCDRRKSRDWQETPLAYLHLVAKDATVDRVPPLEIELDFFDRDGKVVIPVPSNPVLIEIAADAPARRAAATIAADANRRCPRTGRAQATEDGRHCDGPRPRARSGRLDRPAGLRPEGAERRRPRRAARRANCTAATTACTPMSERNWTVELDPTPLLRGASERVEFQFPQPTERPDRRHLPHATKTWTRSRPRPR